MRRGRNKHLYPSWGKKRKERASWVEELGLDGSLAPSWPDCQDKDMLEEEKGTVKPSP